MVKTATQLQDIDTSLETRLPAIVQLSKVAAPFTTVQNRAQVTNFAADLLPRFGIERFAVQAIQEIQGEYGPNGERVFKPVNDIHDAVRLVGTWVQNANISGQYIGTGGAVNNSDYIEITFYGTGLNLITITGNTNLRTVAVSVDGGSSSTVQWDIATNSAIKTNRNYNANDIVSMVQGLSVGLHTVKIQQNNNTNFFVVGYEVVNANSTLQQLPGSSYAGGQRLYASALTTSSPTSGFTNTYGTPGTRGGHVLVYQKSDGTIAKDIRYTETAAAYLASANHANEEVIRIHHWREFGAGRTDDFSSLLSGGASKAFTLDDGTTTLTGDTVSTPTNEGLACAGSGKFWTLTFVGTGLDFIRSDTNTIAVDQHTVFVDGSSVGTLTGTGVTTQRVQKICSGLPYGTHTVRLNRDAFVNAGILAHQLIIYGPRIPALPTGAVALADYFVMADFAANVTAGLDNLATGVLRKNATREMIYATPSGSYAVGLDPTLYVSGQQVTIAISGASLKYTFFGTGFELRGRANTVFTGNATLSIDGNANWSSFSSSAYGGFSIVNSTTGQISQAASNTLGSGIRISGLTLGLHTITLTNNAASSYVIEALDVITPIHAPKLNGPFVVQNTLAIGSCAVRDLRSFGENQIVQQKSCSQAIGVTSGVSSASTSYVPIPDLSVSVVVPKSALYLLSYSYTATPTGASSSQTSKMFLNGAEVGVEKRSDAGTATSPQISTADQFVAFLTAGVHKVDVYWRTNGTGTATSNGLARNLTVREL